MSPPPGRWKDESKILVLGETMNRFLMVGIAIAMLSLPSSLGAWQAKREWQTLLDKRTFTGERGGKLPYRLLKPDDYDAKKSYPLVVFLHGAGERGSDNDKQLIHGVAEFVRDENRKKYPCFLIAPQCPDGKKWVEVDWGAASHHMPAEPSQSEALVLELIAALQKEYSIDAKRIYVTGLSMGGFGTWDLICRKPGLFAAAVPVCGGGDEMQAAKIAQLPIWAFHGAKDDAVKVSRTRNMIEAIKKAGGHPKYTEYPKEGHASWVPAYKDAEMMKWLFEQKLK
jgi:predicted peptidase